MSSRRFSYLGVRIAIPLNVATAVSEEPPPSIWTDTACHSIYKGETFHIFTICTMYAYVFVILFLQATSPELKSDAHLQWIEYLKLVHENLNPSANLSAVKSREKAWAAVKVTIIKHRPLKLQLLSMDLQFNAIK